MELCSASQALRLKPIDITIDEDERRARVVQLGSYMKIWAGAVKSFITIDVNAVVTTHTPWRLEA